MSLADGQVLDGKYVIVRRIAEGGMSSVYLGTNQRIGKDVAVKVLSAAMAYADDVVERFEREARIVSRIRSPYVADVYDFGTLESGSWSWSTSKARASARSWSASTRCP
jgi:serine/threonine-protein kinase